MGIKQANEHTLPYPTAEIENRVFKKATERKRDFHFSKHQRGKFGT